MATFQEMREKHRSDSMLTLSFFLFFLLLFFFDKEYTRTIQELVKNPENISDVLKRAWFVFFLTLIGPCVTYFFGVITIAKRDLYYSIDNVIFGRRIKINQYICEKILDLKIELTEKDRLCLDKLSGLIDNPQICRRIMNLFYRYIEKADIVNPELKSHAFIYWGDYFSSIMFIFWGTLSILGAITIVLFDGSITAMRIVIILIIVVLIGLNLKEAMGGKTAKKQFDIPETQINEVHRNAAHDILVDLRSERFFLND